ncbi:MAG: hypothetical protein KGO92_01365 [Bacteroidota bacterium]|nr:hypothetical protein [Bacteroidota bacterium]
MATYLVSRSESKKRKSLLLGYLYLVISIGVLIVSITMDGRSNLIRILNVVVFLNFGWVGFEKIRNAKCEKSLEITPGIIRFNQKFDLRRFTEISWDDIRWIKFDKNDTVLFFQDSSIQKNLELTDFTESQQENIREAIQDQARQRSIRLINFSGPLSEAV